MMRRHFVSVCALALAASVANAQSKQPPAKADSAAPPPAQGGGATVAPLPAKTIQREVFTYSRSGRRDPMISLMASGDIRPLITEVKLIAIWYDEGGSNHAAVLANVKDPKIQYRVKVGQMLGRMTVTSITRKEVVFTLNEFGFSRQERLLIKPDTARKL